MPFSLLDLEKKRTAHVMVCISPTSRD